MKYPLIGFVLGVPLLALSVVGGVLAWHALGGRSSPSVWTVTDDSPLIAFGAEDDGQVDPSLARRGLGVAKSDATFRHLIGTSAVTVVGTSAGFPVDGAIALKLRVVRAGPITADLPYWNMSGWGKKDTPAQCRYGHYVLGWVRDRASGIFSIYVTVDFPRRKVILIRVRARRHVYSWVAGKPHPSCPQPKTA